MDWPPSAEALYLSTSASRPIFQGDVFAEVPFVKARAGDSLDEDPKITVERRHVITVLHPCDMYSEQGRVLNRVQTVAAVRKADTRIPDDWGGAFAVSPLPDLFKEGEMWIAHLTRLANIDRSYLTVDRRVKCLSELGWAVFRQRLAVATTRGMPTLNDLLAVGSVAWQETELADIWQQAGRVPRDFYDWLDESDPELGGMSRRQALERGMVENIRKSMYAALA